MNRFLIPLGVFALLVIVLGVGIKRSPEKGIIISPLLGKPAPAAKGPVIPAGATAECNDSSYSMSHDKALTCKGHGGVRHWLKP